MKKCWTGATGPGSMVSPGEPKDVAANHNATGGPFYVEVLDTDYALNTTCDLERVP